MKSSISLVIIFVIIVGIIYISLFWIFYSIANKDIK